MFGSESFALDAFDYWTDVDKYSWVTGDFIWTSFDYIGEASIGWRGYMQKNDFYPWNLAFCGDLDICGWKRPQSFYRDALWKNGNNVSIFVIPPKPSFPVNAEKENWSRWNWHDVVADWNWNGYEKQPMGVEVYSDCEHVELFLNGKSLGKKSTDFSARYTAHWEVPYQPGVLKAVGYMGSKTASECELKTAGTAVRIRLGADRQQLKADGEDLVYITVDLTDQNGIRNPKAENLVHFTVNGPGTLIAVGNANPVSLESYIQPQRKAWQGRCLAIIRSGNTPGMITVKAESDGLESSEISIRSGD